MLAANISMTPASSWGVILLLIVLSVCLAIIFTNLTERTAKTFSNTAEPESQNTENTQYTRIDLAALQARNANDPASHSGPHGVYDWATDPSSGYTA